MTTPHTPTPNPPPDPPPSADQRPLYVGYLPMPQRHRRFARCAVPALILSLLAASAIIAANQPNPGPAVWAATTTTIEGDLILHPYPMLIVRQATTTTTTNNNNNPDEPTACYLLVEADKHAPRPQRFESLQTTTTPIRIRATGYTLTRPDDNPPIPPTPPTSTTTAAAPPLRMLELIPTPDAIEPIASDGPTTRPTTSPTPITTHSFTPTGDTLTLHAEILDSKCFLGAMKPGQGRTHRACAQLCIQGGIPPMIEARDHNNSPRRLLLLTPEGGPANDLVLPHAALPVLIRGQLARLGNAEALRIESIEPR
ncbi:MAG: hypothetical protein ACTS3F_04620 [Phycisphaerales bacterium]